MLPGYGQPGGGTLKPTKHVRLGVGVRGIPSYPWAAGPITCIVAAVIGTSNLMAVPGLETRNLPGGTGEGRLSQQWMGPYPSCAGLGEVRTRLILMVALSRYPFRKLWEIVSSRARVWVC